METKVLVLENVTDLDGEIASYLVKKRDEEKWDIDIVYNLDSKGVTPELIQKIISADVIAMQSTFSNMTQFEQFIDLFIHLHTTTGKKFDLRVLYTHESFPSFLSQDVEKEYRDKIGVLMNGGCVIYDIVCERKEKREKRKLFDDSQLFKTILYFFDEVKLWYNPSRDLIWHVRKPNVVLPMDEYYLLFPKFVTRSELIATPKVNKFDSITQGDIRILKEILRDFDVILDGQIEDLTHNDEVKKMFGEDEIKTLMRSHRKRETLLNKLKTIL